MPLGGHVVLLPRIESTVVTFRKLYRQRCGIVAAKFINKYSYFISNFPEFLCYLGLYDYLFFCMNWVFRYSYCVVIRSLCIPFSYIVLLGPEARNRNTQFPQSGARAYIVLIFVFSCQIKSPYRLSPAGPSHCCDAQLRWLQLLWGNSCAALLK